MVIQLTNIIIVILHLFLIFSPNLLFIVSFPKWIYKFLLLIPILVVTHWRLFENQCILTIFQKKLGAVEKDGSFSNKYLRWFYEPIMKFFNLEWNNENLDVIIDMHWLVNFLIIWYFTFF
jgi:hypothetical protein